MFRVKQFSPSSSRVHLIMRHNVNICNPINGGSRQQRQKAPSSCDVWLYSRRHSVDSPPKSASKPVQRDEVLGAKVRNGSAYENGIIISLNTVRAIIWTAVFLVYTLPLVNVKSEPGWVLSRLSFATSPSSSLCLWPQRSASVIAIANASASRLLLLLLISFITIKSN